jgi:hypothetical protein
MVEERQSAEANGLAAEVHASRATCGIPPGRPASTTNSNHGQTSAAKASEAIARRRRRLSVIARFGTVGIIATLLYFMTTMILGRPPFAIDPLAANSAGVAVSLLFSYLGHHRCTFRVQMDIDSLCRVFSLSQPGYSFSAARRWQRHATSGATTT